MLRRHNFFNNWVMKVGGINQREPVSHILSSISSSNLMALINTFL